MEVVERFESARRAEEALPFMPYPVLVRSLGRLTELGVVGQGKPSAMLVVARLLDLGRARRSGLTAEHFEQALEDYREAVQGNPVSAVVEALERILETARRASETRDLEDKVQAAAYGAR